MSRCDSPLSADRPLLGARADALGVSFRVWAPAAHRVDVAVQALNGTVRHHPLAAEPDGHFSGHVSGLAPGIRYRYRLDASAAWPDPCARYLPEGPHGAAMVVDEQAFQWTDAAWRGVRLDGQLIYELHVGTFTPTGTLDAAIEKLPHLRALGVTVIELMPLAECPGRWNWGYDGVGLYAPYHVYGDPDALRRFVDAAHQMGLAVILDVVYNHLGPDGNHLRRFSPHYFTARYANEWGDAFNFDGPDSRAVRDYVIGSACHWITSYHLDGLRLDATQSMHDRSPQHVVAELAACARVAAGDRSILLIAENEPQQANLVRAPEAGGYGLDAVWNDDFHHSARVALTGRHEGYFHDHRGRSQEFVSALRHGFLFQGQHYAWQNQARGAPALDVPFSAFVHFLQNHDQIANTFYGQRIQDLTSAGRLRALTAVMLLGPQTPMLFMGQEFAASAPFTFFADHEPELAAKVHAGRRAFVAQFKSYATEAAQQAIPDPALESTFAQCRFDWAECETHAPALRFHQDLIRLRRHDPVLSVQGSLRLEGAVLSERAFVLRWLGSPAGERLLVVNLGDELDFTPAPEPLLAPPHEGRWVLSWSSDDPAYGGPGTLHPGQDGRWTLPGESAVLLANAPALSPSLQERQP